MSRGAADNVGPEGHGGAVGLIVLLVLALLLVLVAISCLGCGFTEEANAGKVEAVAEAAIAAEEVNASLADLRKTVETAVERVEGDQNVGALSGGAPYLLAVSFAALWLLGTVQKRTLATVVRVLMRSIEEAPGGGAVKRVVARKARTARLAKKVNRLKQLFVDL